MADLFASLLPVRLNDGTADANNAVVTNAVPSSSAYALTVRQIGVPAAAVLADAVANPTVASIGSYPFWYNGTTWDRATGSAGAGLLVNIGSNNTVRGTVAHDAVGSAINPLLIGGYAKAAAPTDVSADGDAVQTWHLRNGAVATVLTAAGALIGGDAANGLDVDVTRVTGTVTVDSELPAAAALADATANPTVPGVGGFLMGFNGTTWDRIRTANTGRLQVDVITGGGSNASVLVDNAGFTDGTSSVTGVGYIFDEVAGTALTENDIAAARIDSKRAQIGVIEDATTRGQRAAVSAGGALLVDTELTAVAALADATANPTITNIASMLMGYNGTTWDRVRTANTGRLQVDVVTGGGSPPPDGIPTSYTAIRLYGTTSATASGSTASVVTNTPANTKPFYVKHVLVGSSGAVKWQVKFGATVLATGFGVAASGSIPVIFDPPLTGTGDGSTALTVDVTNRDQSATDLYARLGGYVLT